ncbi:MAG: metallophosphoesterase family protein [Lachnospiraceae bacterium]|nr:metallophosphoesterase family protein [Lachnospiraceae bacterium]
MRILCLADNESKSLWDFYEPGKLKGVDIILSCGDLDPRYLSFLATFTHAPVYYIHGNHDEKYKRIPPDGCTCLDCDMLVYEGVRILGIEGCLKYREGEYQYEQWQMDRKVMKLRHLIRKHGGFDILMTHAPARHVGDGEDRAHQGFEAYTRLLEEYRPRYFLHGHVHPTYSRSYKRLNSYGDTLIINAFEKYDFEYETEWEERMNELGKKHKEGDPLHTGGTA